MRLGRVCIDTGYVVDLDNENMVEQAKEALLEDVFNAIKYNEIGEWIRIEKENSTFTEKDIPTFLLPEDQEE